VIRQAALPLSLNRSPSFDNFIADGNEEALAALQQAIQLGQAGFLSLWGANGSGKSHLLQAACRAAAESDQTCAYVPLGQHINHGPACLSGLAHNRLLCIDELEQLVGHPPWQEALYNLYNAVQQGGGLLIGASHRPPRDLPLALADLKSRLAWGTGYHLRPASDTTKSRILQRLALERGMQLPDDAVRYLLHHQSRDLHSLTQLLEQLDRASLAAQRRLTVRFISEQLHPADHPTENQ
jgi:DnaA family protein